MFEPVTQILRFGMSDLHAKVGQTCVQNIDKNLPFIPGELQPHDPSISWIMMFLLFRLHLPNTPIQKPGCSLVYGLV